MSQSGSHISVDTSSTVEFAHRRTGIVPNGSRATTPYTYVTSARNDRHQSQPHSQHYARLQEHADSIIRTAHGDGDVPNVRHESRQGSFVSGSQQMCEIEAPKHSRNPVIPQRVDNTTPPAIEELVRRTTGDTSSTRNSSLVQSDAIFSRPSTTRSSITGIEIESLTRTDTGSSIGGLAKSMTSKIPGIRTYRSSSGKALEKTSLQDRGGPDDVTSAQNVKKARKLSFQLPSGLNVKSPPETPHKPFPVMEETPTCEPSVRAPLPGSPSKYAGLAARRQVKMDLTLPIGLPDLSKAKEHDGTHPSIMSISPSRPRSPKTPWHREKELNWNRDLEFASTKIASNAEGYSTQVHTPSMGTLDDGELRIEQTLPPGPSPLVTPKFECPPQKVRDRRYISRPSIKDNRGGWLSTSGSDFGSTPDVHSTPEVEEGMTEQEAHVQKDLFQLAKTSKTARARRWPWNRSKASGSEELPRMRDARDEGGKSTTVTIFRRSHRFSENLDNEKKEKKSSKRTGAPWRREKPIDKPPLPSASLANMLVPPTFVPPGCEKVPTPPTYDSAREVRGKLADFFFDMNGFPSAKRKPKASSGGYWDSNAVLMSMHTDLDLTNNKDEEGPEGRAPPATFHFGPVNDTPGATTTPGLYTGPDGSLKVKGFPASPSQTSPPTLTPGAQDSWFRMHYGDHSADEELLTAAALKEADERRKFEWLVPEHLPNSPLCPLHFKYVGPSKGLCYWHGRKSNGWGVEPGRNYISHPMEIGQGSSGGWEVGRPVAPKDQKKKRRLKSLSNSA